LGGKGGFPFPARWAVGAAPHLQPVQR